jgi:hypothetical protein
MNQPCKHEPLSMVISSSHEQVRNLVHLMALTMASWTCMYMNSTRTQPTISNQCMLGLFGIPKLLKSSYKLSYSNITQPWDKTYKIYFICKIIQFPSHVGLFICAKIDLRPLWTYNFMFFKWAQSCAMYYLPFFTPNFGMSHNAIL